jgi:membrane protease subunit (stomatin/prohibitin family)
MSGRLRKRAAGLMQQLDAGAGYRDRIERDLAKRLGDKQADAQPRVAAGLTCATCATANDSDARFCKGCGATLQ